jgi:lipopolysaccharide biosynthesis glycosyltransferase
VVAAQPTGFGAQRRNAIVLWTDANLFPVAAFLGSRLGALNPREDTDVIIVSESWPDLQKAEALGEPFRLFNFNPRDLVGRLPDGFFHAIFYRYFLPELFASAYRRLLYIDTDVYPRDPRLFGLFDLDLRGAPIAAVRDLLLAFPGHPDRSELAATGREQDRKYLNSGVLLIDSDAFRRDRIAERLCAMIREKRQALRYPDQTPLNIILDGKWVELSPAMNMLPAERDSFVSAVFEPVLLHYAGSRKPWQGSALNAPQPMRAELEYYLAASPWSDFMGKFGDTGAPPPPAAEKRGNFMERGMIDRRRVIDHLRSTAFADVAAGIVERRPEFLAAL